MLTEQERAFLAALAKAPIPTDVMGLRQAMDTFAPMGPYLVTADEIADPQALDLWLDVSGKRMQTGNTRTMIFGVAEIVSYLSRFMTLYPGDLITTGTPPGVGLGRKPEPLYLKPGDEVRLGIEKLGTQQQVVIPWRREIESTNV